MQEIRHQHNWKQTSKYFTIHKVSQYVPTKKFQRAPFFPSNMHCNFCEFCNFSGDEICETSKAYLPADKIIERVSIKGVPDGGAEIKHEEKVELAEDPSRSDAEKAGDEKCMVVNIVNFGSAVSVVMNKKYVRVSAAHEVAARPGKYGPVKSAELWKEPRKET
ncbi:hypothetical protein BOTCAL_0109g00190 [Botryotinia calthae]|uniref:Uncharacterized protein n=1 Tax=Botryotinia calthae TaxID=38488 RepID=A0A4Y8D819_9HELO|nr:hypothetical protein BOTCAL_0109g00190 [Botryotinia calthae]